MSTKGKLVDYLVDLGVKPIAAKSERPTTQGKNEPFHQTLQKWLNARPPVATIEAVQRLVGDQAGSGADPGTADARLPCLGTAPAARDRTPPIFELTTTSSAGSPPHLHVPTPSGLAPTPRRTRLTLHAGSGEATLRVMGNGQVKALSCLFDVATGRAEQSVHLH